MSNQTIYLKDYCPPNIKVHHIHLEFDIKSLDEVMVTSSMHVSRLLPGEIKLDGEHLNLVSLKINGIPLEGNAYELSEAGLDLLDCPDEFDLVIVTKLNPKSNTTLSGLYASRTMLCTQCEAQGFRRITFFPDRPDVLTVFTAKIIADSASFPHLLSNGNLVESGVDEQGRKVVVWHDPFLKPSYLFALVAGDLARVSDSYVTSSGRKVGLDIFVEHGDEHLCATAMRSVKRAMRWDEERFGREYDLEHYIIVAVKDFNMGAMENKGLNIFNAKYVLADEKIATDEDMITIENIIGHEYFHNWTGNRVTCRDWFQLSLKEGLTIYRDHLFSQDMNHPVVQRIKEVSRLRRIQFPEDRGTMAHPVQPKAYQQIDNFYTATVYEKGGEIVRMYQVILGDQGFRRGMDLYFQRHDGQAVTIEDFFAAMQDANGVDLKHFKRWYDVSGTPEVLVEDRVEQGVLKIQMTQNMPEPLYIPIRFAAFSKRLGKLNLPDYVILEQKSQTFEFSVEDDDIVVNYLQGFSAPIILKKHFSPAALAHLLQAETDGFALWDLKQSMLIDCIQNISTVPAELIEAMQFWLESNQHDNGLLAELLKVPSFEECLVGLKDVNPPKLAQIRKDVERHLAKALNSQIQKAYNKLASIEKSKLTIGERSFKLICVYYLALGNEASFIPEVYQQFSCSQNMTETMAYFRTLMEVDMDGYQQQAIEQFLQHWQHQELVLDKWLAMQAGFLSLEHTKKLVNHPCFHWENPNKVSALIGSFIANPKYFHAEDGSGYQFLTDCILKLDKINPHVAARIVTPFTRWDWLDNKRQQMIFECLQKLKSASLSANVDELVSHALPNH